MPFAQTVSAVSTGYGDRIIESTGLYEKFALIEVATKDGLTIAFELSPDQLDTLAADIGSARERLAEMGPE